MANEDTALKEPSKMDRVREAMKELGKDAKPAAIQEWLMNTHKLVVDKGMISAYKNKIGKEAEAEKAAKARPAKAAGAKSSDVQVNGNGPALPDLIRRVRTLVTDVGSTDAVKELVDALA